MVDPVRSSKETLRVYELERRKLTIELPSEIRVGETFNVTGKLTVDGRGMGGQTVNLYIKGSRRASTTTASDGSYSFSTTISTPGSYTIYTEAEVERRYKRY